MRHKQATVIMSVSFHLNDDERNLVLNVYKDLTSSTLLEKCLMGRTQNPNETFHSKVWRKISKSKFYDLFTVVYAVAQTIVEHNIGFTRSHVLHQMGLPVPSPAAVRHLDKLDAERQRKATPKQKEKKERCAPSSDNYGAGAH